MTEVMTEVVICPQCQRYVLIEGACIGCGYGFKAVKRAKKRKPKPKPEVKEPWWAK